MKLPLVTLLLLALWPFVSFLSNNQDDALIYGASIAAYAVGFVALLFGLFALARWLLGAARQAQIAHVLGFGAIATFLYLPLSSALSGLDISLGTVRIAIWLVVTLVILLVVWRVSRHRQTGLVFAAVAAVMIALPAANIAAFLVTSKDIDRVSGAAPTPEAAPAGARPNVYWFVFDAYARADVLDDYFGFDNRPFLEALDTRGFGVSTGAVANYASTKLSISTTASMAYFLPVDEALHPAMWTARLQGFNPVVERFKGMGYRYVHVEPGGNNLKTRCGGREDLCITADPVGVLSINEAEVGLLQLTPVFPIVRRLLPQFLSFDFTTIDDVQAKLSVPSTGPQFVFAHILSPHPPQRFDNRCGRIRSVEFDLAGDDYAAVLDGYINDLKCLNPRILELVDRILERDDSDPIIILQSDHGLRANLAPLGADAGRHVPRELVAYANLHAMRTPRRCDSSSGDEFSSVNTFRYVFACLDNEAPELLPNKRFGKRGDALFEIEAGETPNG